MADIYASETGTWDDGSGFSPIGNRTINFTGTYNGQGYVIDSLTINRTDEDYIGLFGYTSSVTIDSLGLTNCSIIGDDYIGSLVGYITSSSELSNCYATGSVSGDNCSGGLIGYNRNSTVKSCYVTVNVSGSDDYIGGLLGYNYYGTVSDCYATGSVYGDSYIGGLVGYNRYSCTVSTSYAMGGVSGSFRVGSLVGYNNSSSTVSSCYFNAESTGQSAGIGIDFNSQTVTALTTNQMKASSNFDGWDFNDTWEISEGITFPRLIDLADAPVVLHTLAAEIIVGELYTDTIPLVYMDSQTVTLELLIYPDGMALSQDSIITWTPTAVGDTIVKVTATDDAGLTSTYSFTLTVNPTCLQPTISSVDNVTGESAEITWVETGDATLWDIEVFESSSSATGTSTYADVDVTTYELTSLSVLTEYSVNVRANCGDGDYSEWSTYESFSTLMATQSNPTGCGLAFGISSNETTAVPVLVTNEGVLGTDITLSEVRVIITHTWDADLDISLISPANIEIDLSSDNGFSGDNYGDTTAVDCSGYTTFSMSGADGAITDGSAPFSGSYIPEGDFEDFNDLTTNAAGEWILSVYDDTDDDVGTIEYIELVFVSLTATAIDEVEEAEIKVYPNPAKDILYVEVNDLFVGGDAQIKLYAMNGQTVYQKDIEGSSAVLESINTSSLPAGLYFVSIVSNDFTKTIKVIVE
jgi:subtilisin-like proprotein convertase family protein